MTRTLLRMVLGRVHYRIQAIEDMLGMDLGDVGLAAEADVAPLRRLPAFDGRLAGNFEALERLRLLFASNGYDVSLTDVADLWHAWCEHRSAVGDLPDFDAYTVEEWARFYEFVGLRR